MRCLCTNSAWSKAERGPKLNLKFGPQCFLSDPTWFVCKAVTFFNEIDLHPHNSYYLRNTIKLIRRSSSVIDEYIYSVRLHDIW